MTGENLPGRGGGGGHLLLELPVLLLKSSLSMPAASTNLPQSPGKGISQGRGGGHPVVMQQIVEA